MTRRPSGESGGGGELVGAAPGLCLGPGRGSPLRATASASGCSGIHFPSTGPENGAVAFLPADVILGPSSLVVRPFIAMILALS